MSFEDDLHNLSALSAIQLRRWYVQQLGISQSKRAWAKNIGPNPSLLEMAQGRAPTPEHAGVASRILYDVMERPDLIVQIPSLDSPKTWNDQATMTGLILWAFQPWKNFRYDPQSETAVHVLGNGQWVTHLKGKDSEGFMILQIQRYMQELRIIGFTEIVKALNDQGYMSLNPTDYNMEASDFGTALSACDHAFNKFVDRHGATKEIMDQIVRTPIMFFDTSTMNCVQNLVAVGNGVIPTDDFIDITDIGDNMALTAGRLIPADPEFVLSNAAGLAWPDFEPFNKLMDLRDSFRLGVEEDSTWDEWMDGARVIGTHILTNYCPTYSRFLDHAFPVNSDGLPSERDAFLRLLGAACFGTNLKLVAAMIGAPNAGKDTVIKWLSMILGDGQVGVLSPTALSANSDDQRAFAPLKGARVAVVSGEVGEGRGSAILGEKLKSITSGGGTLTVAEKYEKPTTIFFDGMLIMQGNSVPQIQGGDRALYRNRLVAVEFKYPFPLKANSFEREYRREAPWFLMVLFLAYLDYEHRGGGMQGVDPPAEWHAFSKEIEAGADPLAVIDACVTSPSKNIEIPSPIFYKALSILAEKQLGIKYPITAQRWAQRMKRAGVDLSRSSGPNPWRSRVSRTDYTGWLMHFTLNAENSDGFFTQQDWTNAIAQATMAASGSI